MVGWPSLTVLKLLRYNKDIEKEFPNMKNYIALIFTSILASTAFASSIVPVSTLSCTRDYNAWGQSGNCDCPQETRYERAIGQCVQGAAVAISLDGVLQTETNLDGDVSAIILSNDSRESYELVLTNAMRSEIEELKAQELNYRITGEVVENNDASQTISRPKIIVKEIQILETLRADLIYPFF